MESPSADIPADVSSAETPVVASPPAMTTTAPEEATATEAAADSADSASQGGEESDANTGSSFEELDLPASSSEGRETSLKKDEDEGER